MQLIFSRLIPSFLQVLQKKQPKKRKKRTAVHPILGAVLKFHKDDDDDDDEGGTPPACVEEVLMHVEE
jgi:hypothetical protein